MSRLYLLMIRLAVGLSACVAVFLFPYLAPFDIYYYHCQAQENKLSQTVGKSSFSHFLLREAVDDPAIVTYHNYSDSLTPCLLVSSADNLAHSLDPDQARQNIQPDL